ncbi:hypothetical protein [Helcococcus ovis]
MKRDDKDKILIEKINTRYKKRNIKIKYNYKKLVIFGFVLLFFIIILLLIFTKIFSLIGNLTSKSAIKNSNNQIKDKNLISNDSKLKNENSKVLIKKIEDIMKNSENVLKTEIKSFIDNQKLKKQNINIGYLNLKDKDKKIIKISETNLIPMNNNNVFIISMIAEDLFKEKKLDYSMNIDISKFVEKDEKTIITLQQLISDMIIKGGNWRINLVLEKLKTNVNDWKTYANKKYKILINKENEMKIEDIFKILNLVLSKKNNEFIYPYTYNNLSNSAEHYDSIYKIYLNNFMGFVGSYEYAYNLELGFILGEKPFMFLIQTDYSDSGIPSAIREILFNWNQKYNK